MASLEPQFHGTSRFRIVSRIAVGAVGEIYKVIDEQRGTFVALRTLRNVKPELARTLELDFRALKAVRHPALVSLGELMRVDGVWFYTMEFVEGESLADYVRPRGSEPDKDLSHAVSPRGLSEVRLRSALAQLVRGLAALHEASRVHGSVEPDHVRVTAQGRLVLLESELLGKHQGIDTDQRLIGALPFVAPERLEDAPSSSATDWYGVGAILFQALSGVSPFPALGADLLGQKQRSVPELPLGRSYPPDLARLCRALLSIDPDARPDYEEVRAILGMGHEPDTRVSQTFSLLGDTPPFVGRRRELPLLAEAFERTRHGAVSTLCLHGPVGIGKRTLSAQLARKLRSDYPQLVHLWGRAERDGPRAFRGIGSAVEGAARYLATLDQSSVATLLPSDASIIARMFPAFAPLVPEPPQDTAQQDPKALRRACVRALRGLFRNLSKRHPLLIVLEDMQWADPDAWYVLEALLRPPAPPDMLVVLIVEGDPRKSTEHLRSFLERNRDQVTLMPLRELRPEASRELALRLLEAGGVRDPKLAERLAVEGHGEPMRIDALARYFLHAGVPIREELALPDLLWARVEHLPVEARQLLTVLCFARTPLAAEVAAEAGDLPPEGVERLLTMLRSGNLLRIHRDVDGDRFGPSHPAVRAAVCARANVQPAVLHARIARSLARSRGPDDVLAAHLLEAGSRERAAEAVARAADQARDRLAFDTAVALYQEAVSLSEHRPDAKKRLRTELAHAYAHAGQSEKAARAYVEAASLSDPSEALDLECRAAHQLLRIGQIANGLAMISGLLAQLDVRLPRSTGSALVSYVYHRTALALRGFSFKQTEPTHIPPSDLVRADILGSLALALGMIDLVRGADVQTRYLLLALRLGDAGRVARALALEAGIEAAVSDAGSEVYRATLARGESLATAANDAQAQSLLLSVRATAAFLHGRFREHVQLSLEAERRLSLHGSYVDWEIGRARVFRAIARTLLGEIKATTETVTEQIREARERGDRYTDTHLTLSSGYLFSLAADEPLIAMAALQDGLSGWQQDTFHMHAFFHLRGVVNTELYTRHGRPYSRVMAAWPGLSKSFLLRIPFAAHGAKHLRGCAAIAQAQADRQDRELLLSDAADCGEKLIASRTPYVIGFGYTLRAAVDAMRGDRERATRRLEHAEAAFYEGEMTLYAAATRYQLGRLQGGARGQELAARAHEWLLAQQVRRPHAFFRMLLPGFD